MRHLGAGISLHPKLAGLFGFFEVTRDLFVVDSRYEIPLRLTCMVAPFVCLSCVSGCDGGFSNRGMPDAQPRIGNCEIWVEFDSALIKGNSKWRGSCPLAGAKSFQGFERGRS